jgi:hypothetical protein
MLTIYSNYASSNVVEANTPILSLDNAKLPSTVRSAVMLLLQHVRVNMLLIL